MPSKKMLRKWELLGIALIFFAGAALHFAFEWSGYWKPIAWLVAVNESTWEHFKLAFWPGVVWTLVGYFVVGKRTRNYWLGRAVGLLSMPVIITVIFYSYTALLGTNYLFIDILSFFLAVCFGQFISYTLFLARKLNLSYQWLGALAIAGMMAAFVLFTYMPPRLFIFEHVSTHEYGILKEYK
jgi:hypothetical protein